MYFLLRGTERGGEWYSGPSDLHCIRRDGGLHEAGTIGLAHRERRFDTGGCAGHGAVAVVMVAGISVEDGGEGGWDEEDEEG